MRADFGKALVWYRKAAEQGYSRAQFSLALMYQQGKGASQNMAQARKWWDESRASEARERGERTSLIGCGQLLVRDPVVISAFKKEYPTDWTGRVTRLRRGGTLSGDELELLEDLIQNEAREYLRFYGKGPDYDESDPADGGLFPIDVVGLGGIYFVRGYEFGNSGYFRSLQQAEQDVERRWSGVDILGPDQISGRSAKPR